MRHLIGIYQAERDWEKAIDNATRYEEVTGEPMGKLISQFECELADRYRGLSKPDDALQAIARAYQADGTSVRAGILKAGSRPSAVTTRRLSARSSVPRGTIRNTCRKSFRH